MYQGDHSIKFFSEYFIPTDSSTVDDITSFDTWTSFYLIPSSRPSVASPGVNVKLVDIPGRLEPLDMTNFLSSVPSFGTRSGSWEFYVDNDHMPWQDLQAKIINALHGKKKYVVLSDDYRYYYEGRLAVDTWKSEQTNSMVTINYQLYPYKKRRGDDYHVTNVPTNNPDESNYKIPTTAYPFPIYYQVTEVANGSNVKLRFNGGRQITHSDVTSSYAELGRSDVSAGLAYNTIAITGNGTVRFKWREVRI